MFYEFYTIKLMRHAYYRFLQLKHALHGDSELFKKLDSTSNQLLNVIALHHANRDALTVTSALALKAIASRSALYEKLNELVKLGLITKDSIYMNRKGKILVPTILADEYFSSLGCAIEASLIEK